MIAFVPSRYRILPVCSYSHSLPSRASVILFVFGLFLSLRWTALYAQERSRANPHAHGEAHLGTSYRPRGVSNTETVLSLILSIRRPRLRRGLLQQRRIVPGCLKRRMLWGGVPSMAFPSHRYRGTPCQRFAGVWRSYLPPQSFLPVGIGEVTPATNSAPFQFRLPPQSFLPVGIGEAILLIFGLATPATSHAGVALHVLPGDASGVTFTSTLTLILALVDAW